MASTHGVSSSASVYTGAWVRSLAISRAAPEAPPWDPRYGSVGRAKPHYLSHAPGPSWLTAALAALDEVDNEVAEEGLPEIDTATKAEAKRIVSVLARHPFAPTVYPTQEGEIAIHFKSPNMPNSVVILLNNSAQADCYAYTGGRSRRAHYDVSSDIPDVFVREQMRRLLPEQIDVQARSWEIGPPSMMFLQNLPFI